MILQAQSMRVTSDSPRGTASLQSRRTAHFTEVEVHSIQRLMSGKATKEKEKRRRCKMELLAGHPIFPSLLLECTSASAAGAALTPLGPRAPPLLWGINGTGCSTISAHKQQDQPPQKSCAGSPQGPPELPSPVQGGCSPLQVQPSQCEATPVCHHTSPAEPPLSGCYRPSTGITCTAKSHLFFLYIFALQVGHQHQECQGSPSSQESRRAALAAEAVPPPPRHLQPPPSGTRSGFISSLLGLG